MNKTKVVSRLIVEINWRFRGVSEKEVERKLLNEGWSVGAVRQALHAVSFGSVS